VGAILDHGRCRFVVVADRVYAINLIPLEQANRNLPTGRRIAGFRWRYVSLSFNEQLDKSAEREIAFSTPVAGDGGISSSQEPVAGRVRKKNGEREREGETRANLGSSSKCGACARQRPKCSYFRFDRAGESRRERLLIFFAKQSNKQVTVYKCAYPVARADRNSHFVRLRLSTRILTH